MLSLLTPVVIHLYQKTVPNKRWTSFQTYLAISIVLQLRTNSFRYHELNVQHLFSLILVLIPERFTFCTISCGDKMATYRTDRTVQLAIARRNNLWPHRCGSLLSLLVSAVNGAACEGCCWCIRPAVSLVIHVAHFIFQLAILDSQISWKCSWSVNSWSLCPGITHSTARTVLLNGL